MKRQRGAALALALGLCVFAAGCAQEHSHVLRYCGAVEPACTENGMQEHWECEICGALFYDEEGNLPATEIGIPALGHNLVSETILEATCEEAGLRHSVCLRCGQEVLREEIPAEGHIFKSYVITQNATCTREGEKVRTCVVCSKTETVSIPMEAHNWDTNNVCSVCSYACPVTDGLVFTEISGESGTVGYSVSSGDILTAKQVFVPYYHEGLPVLEIADGVFRDCSSLTRATVYAAAERLGVSAFRGCFALTEAVLPESLCEIGAEAFYGCRALRSLSIGSAVKEIGRSAFYGCGSLEHIFVDEENAVYASEGNCLVERENALLIVGGADAEIPDWIREIGDNAFLNNDHVAELDLPRTLVRIGSAAFYGCGNLKTVRYDGTVAQWEAVSKGDLWRGGAQFQVLCTDGEAVS